MILIVPLVVLSARLFAYNMSMHGLVQTTDDHRMPY